MNHQPAWQRADDIWAAMRPLLAKLMAHLGPLEHAISPLAFRPLPLALAQGATCQRTHRTA